MRSKCMKREEDNRPFYSSLSLYRSETIFNTLDNYSNVSMIARSTLVSLRYKGSATFQDGAGNCKMAYWPEFGKGPLCSIQHLNTARNHRFCQQFGNFSKLFSDLVNGHPDMFQNAVLFYRDLTFNKLTGWF